MENLIFSEEQLDLFENTLPPETDEKGCDSFDDLVYVAPKAACQILLEDLTLDQVGFLQNNLNFDPRFKKVKGDNEDCLYYSRLQRDWIYGESSSFSLTIFFNDIFIHIEDWRNNYV